MQETLEEQALTPAHAEFASRTELLSQAMQHLTTVFDTDSDAHEQFCNRLGAVVAQMRRDYPHKDIGDDPLLKYQLFHVVTGSSHIPDGHIKFFDVAPGVELTPVLPGQIGRFETFITEWHGRFYGSASQAQRLQ